MPVPHLEIRIVQRSKGSSAVAGAAYQAGEKLFSEYDQKMKNYLYKKEVVYTEVMLPTNAPPGYADRATLWNAAEEVEKQWNSQLARRFVVALPRETPTEMYPQMMQEYCREHFVSKGMCCDFAIHDPDPPGHNPHCHIMLTMRAIDENGKWLPKSRKVYDLDENGERIRLPPATGKATRRIPLIGTSSTMPRNGDTAGSLFRTSIWNLPEVLSEWICALMNGRDWIRFRPSIWEPPFALWNARALKPTSAISTEILKPPTA